MLRINREITNHGNRRGRLRLVIAACAIVLVVAGMILVYESLSPGGGSAGSRITQQQSPETTGTAIVPTDAATRPIHQTPSPHSSTPRTLRGHSHLVGIVDLSSDGATLLSVDLGGIIQVWDFHAGVPLTKIDASPIGLRRAVLTPNGENVIACGKDSAVQMWSSKTGKFVREFRGHTETVTAICCLPGGDQFLTSSFDVSIILWDIRKGDVIRQFGRASNATEVAPRSVEELAQLDGHFAWIRDLVVLPDGKRAISAGNDAVLLIWDVESGTLAGRLVGHRSVVMELTLSPDGRYAASSSTDKAIIVWDVEEARILQQFEHSRERAPAFAFATDSRSL